MTVIFADIGGTHTRFACEIDGELRNVSKVPSARYETFADSLAAYVAGHGYENKGDLYLAVAAHDNGHGEWHFSNNSHWVIRPAELARLGWHVRLIVMDFMASARGAVSASPEKLLTVKQGLMTKRPKTVLGPGTGLGMAYAITLPDGKIHIQETYGGRMLMAAITDEQHDIIRMIQHLKGRGAVVECEDIVSGRGLPLLYRAVCEQQGYKPVFETAEQLLKAPGDAGVAETLRLFHEFFGLFIHHVVLTGDAFGGVYIDGGIVHRLRETGLFDSDTIVRFFDLPGVPVVERHLGQAPIWVVTDPYIALHGLQELKKDV